MGSSTTITISYNKAHLRVRANFCCGLCRTFDSPPPDIFARAQKRFEAERALGHVSFFLVYRERLAELWRRIRSDEFRYIPDDFEIQMTLAAGVPPLEGVSTAPPGPSSSPQTLCTLSLDVSPERLKELRLKWLMLLIAHDLQRLGIKGSPDRAHVRGLLNRALEGCRVASEAIVRLENHPLPHGATYGFYRLHHGSDLALYIQSVSEVVKPGYLDHLLVRIRQEAGRLGIQMRILEEDLRSDIGLAVHGIERLGLGVPMSILVGQGPDIVASSHGTIARKVTDHGTHTHAQSHDPSDYSGKGLLDVDVRPDKMRAKLVFKESHYQNSSLKLDQDWLMKELTRLRLVELSQDNIKLAVKALKERQDITGLEIAVGTPGTGGTDPILVKQFAAAVKDDEAQVDVRKTRIPGIVKIGQHIAEVVCKVPCVPGRDVYGRELPAPADEVLTVELGEGVERRGATAFYATRDGLVVLEDKRLEVAKVYLHPGDVTLSSGDVRFDGAIVVKGRVDGGAVVQATGDITIMGDVAGGFVLSGGNIEVVQGIVTGDSGYVRARGNLKAGFIENSTVFAGGNIIVDRAILGSKVFCGQSITVVSARSIVAGSEIYLWEALTCVNVGFELGKETLIHLGCSWQIERRIKIKTKRLATLEAHREANQLALRELMRKKDQQLTPKHKELKAELPKRLQRYKAIIDSLQGAVQELSRTKPFNKDAHLDVTDTIQPTTTVLVDDKTLPIKTAMIGVSCVAKPRGDSHFIALTDLSPPSAA